MGDNAEQFISWLEDHLKREVKYQTRVAQYYKRKMFCRGIYQRCKGRINLANNLLSAIYVFRVKTNNQ